MKTAIWISVLGLLVTLAHAQCGCKHTSEYTCWRDCVSNTQECLTKCNDDKCYENCISRHWPGAAPLANISTVNTTAAATTATVAHGYRASSIATRSMQPVSAPAFTASSNSSAPSNTSVIPTRSAPSMLSVTRTDVVSRSANATVSGTAVSSVHPSSKHAHTSGSSLSFEATSAFLMPVVAITATAALWMLQ